MRAKKKEKEISKLTNSANTNTVRDLLESEGANEGVHGTFGSRVIHHSSRSVDQTEPNVSEKPRKRRQTGTRSRPLRSKR